MRLELCTFDVKDVVFGNATQFRDGTLQIDRREIEEQLCGERFKTVSIEIAKPGERVRVVHILDIIEPRAKVGGPQRVFPGLLGPPMKAGGGTTHRLANVAVITTADFEKWESDGSSVASPVERLVDMTGEGARFSPFSQTTNVILSFEPSAGLSLEECDDAIRRAGLWVSEYLANATAGMSPDSRETLHVDPPSREDLPRVAYIYQLQSVSFLRDTFLYGEQTRHLVPTLIHPNEIVDGAIVNGSLSYASCPTYVHQNNRVIEGLYQRHGKELDFVGVILFVGHQLTHQDKERRAHYAAKLAKMLDAQGILSTQEGGGNSIVDQMLTLRFCEELGVKERGDHL